MIIENYPNYSIYENGEIWNTKKNKKMNYHQDKDGYLTVKLWNSGKYKRLKVHRLIALHFIPIVENKPLVDHIDRNKQNNSLDNLRWVSSSENCRNRSAYKKSKLQERYISHNETSYILRIQKLDYRKSFNMKIYTLDDVIQKRNEILFLSTI